MAIEASMIDNSSIYLSTRDESGTRKDFFGPSLSCYTCSDHVQRRHFAFTGHGNRASESSSCHLRFALPLGHTHALCFARPGLAEDERCPTIAPLLLWETALNPCTQLPHYLQRPRRDGLRERIPCGRLAMLPKGKCKWCAMLNSRVM